MDKDWLIEQTNFTISQWDVSMENRYPEVKVWNKDSKKYYKSI